MNKKLRTTINIVAFVLLFALLWSGYNSINNKKKEFRELQTKTEALGNTSKDRVRNAVVTVPDGDTVVGLKDGIGSYKYIDKVTDGKVVLQEQYLKTKFIEGVYEKSSPRLDVIVPMSVSVDSFGGSTYIVLFQDRGDVALEKSYARIGNLSVVIGDISILPSNQADVEYQLSVEYLQKSLPKKIIIPVIDGHFNAERAITGGGDTPPNDLPTACTLDAKQCPDGSYVGRTGPKCEFQACPDTATNEEGTLSGKVSIGPVCGGPERIDDPCKPTPEMYAAKKIYVYTSSNKKTLVRTITPDANGKFSVRLPIGSHYIHMDDQPGGVGGITGVPVTITIRGGATTTISIDVDTGIR
jgi:hypothetical protein